MQAEEQQEEWISKDLGLFIQQTSDSLLKTAGIAGLSALVASGMLMRSKRNGVEDEKLLLPPSLPQELSKQLLLAMHERDVLSNELEAAKWRLSRSNASVISLKEKAAEAKHKLHSLEK